MELCHNTAKCVQNDDVDRIIEQYEWNDIVTSVSPSYWADIPDNFKVLLIDAPCGVTTITNRMPR